MIFIHDLAPFGAQRVAQNIAKYIDKDSFRVTVCSFWGDETLAQDFTASGAEVILLKASRFLDLSAWLRLYQVLTKIKPEIVQTNMPELSVPVRFLSLLMPGLRVVHNVQNPISSEPWYWRLLNRATLGLCGAVIFCSHGIYKEAALNSKRLDKKNFIVQNAVSMEAAAPAAGLALRTELNIAENEKVIACVGRLTRQKGQEILIKATAILRDEKKRLRVLLAGDGETLAALKELVRRLGLEYEVLFLGRRSDIARILSACDIYAAPSRWEGFNIALGEAMSSGRPCIASDIPGHADLLKDGITGIAVPSENADALARGIARLLDSAPEAQRMASTAGDMVRTGFNSAEMVKKFKNIYLGLGLR